VVLEAKPLGTLGNVRVQKQELDKVVKALAAAATIFAGWYWHTEVYPTIKAVRELKQWVATHQQLDNQREADTLRRLKHVERAMDTLHPRKK
jgi:HD superfamily phosphodiesterase